MQISNLSIRKKLTVLMMLVSALMLVLVGGLYVSEEIYSSRASLERELTTLGSALGDSCKKLLMAGEINTTQEVLSSFAAKSNVNAAYLFDSSGKPVAQYLNPAEADFAISNLKKDFPDEKNPFWADLLSPQINSSREHFSLFLPILQDGRQVGVVYLLSDLRDLYGRLNGVVFTALLLLGLFFLLSWWLAGRLQKPVSEPILELVGTMEDVSSKRDFSIRADKKGEDEIGQLVDGFNQLLERVELHRQELIDHQQSLEETVEKRTDELSQMVSVLEAAKFQAEAASEAKSQFLANITHELRTPLIGVLGMNELMFRTSMDDQQEMLAKTVQGSGENLLTLINNVLDFSKIEAGKMQLEKVEFSLYQVIEDVLSLLAGAAGEKGLYLHSHIAMEATCQVVGDEIRIRQIVTNLLGNAIKFTEQGSVSIRLESTKGDSGLADFSLEIRDTGIGMDEDAQEQIFSAFYQADDSHTRKYGGTGLGLAIVMQLVKLLEGHISLESEIGQGSCFKIDFSLPQAGNNDFSIPEKLLRQPALVYVENSTCRAELSSRLASLGLDVEMTDSVAEAWYKIQSAERNGKPFQMVFFNADSVLPDGQMLRQAINDESSLKRLRRILLLKRTDSIVAKDLERKLYLPIGWDNLCDVINKSWHELRLVEKAEQVENNVEPEPGTRAENTILLAGGSLASRELIKITLAPLPLKIDIAANLSELEEKLDQRMFSACLVDLTNLPVDELVEVFKERKLDVPLYLLSPAEAETTSLKPFISAHLQKPFSGEQLLQLLTPTAIENSEKDKDFDSGVKA